jgi:hypothetical protein
MNRVFALVLFPIALQFGCETGWEERSIRVQTQAAGATPVSLARPTVAFAWDGFEATMVEVLKCTGGDCAKKPADYCIDPRGDFANVVAWSVSHQDMSQPRSRGPIAYGVCPAGWDDGITRGSCGSPETVEEGAYYAVRVAGVSCAGGCRDVRGCRWFKVEGGAPKMLGGTGD